MKTTVETIVTPKMCAYTFNGTNLAEMRRAALTPLCSAVGIVGDMSKNQMLTLLIARLDALGCEKELTQASELKAG